MRRRIAVPALTHLAKACNKRLTIKVMHLGHYCQQTRPSLPSKRTGDCDRKNTKQLQYVGDVAVLPQFTEG
jgi:hypothetical protein